MTFLILIQKETMICRTSDIHYQHAKWCHDNGIFIYPVPVSATSKGTYFIVVQEGNKHDQGKLIFKDEPDKNEPSVWEQIRTLYRMIYERKNKVVT
jgi:hypothetical protein